MSQIGNNIEFDGVINNALRQATAPSGVSGTLQAYTEDAAGAVEWVNVPDGAITGPSNFSFFAVPTQTYRFTNVTGGVIWLS